MFTITQNMLSPCWLNLPVKTHTVMGGILMGCNKTVPKLSINLLDIIVACPKPNDFFVHKNTSFSIASEPNGN